MIFDLAQDFHDAVAAIPRRQGYAGQVPREHPKRRVLELLEEAIRRDIHFLDRHPTTLFQCLWNTCWWESKRARVSSSPEESKKLSRLLAEISGFVENSRSEKGMPAKSPWLRSLHPPPLALKLGHRLFLRGQGAPVRRIETVADGRFILCHEADTPVTGGVVRIWDLSNGTERAVLRGGGGQTQPLGPAGDICCFCVSSDCALIATGGRDGHVRLWDAANGVELASSRNAGSGILCIAFSPVSRKLAFGANDGTVWTWDVTSAAGAAAITKHDASVAAVCFSPDGALVASGGWFGDETVKVSDAVSGAEKAILKGHAGAVVKLAFSPSGDSLVSLAEDCTARVWDWVTLTVKKIIGSREACVRSLVVSDDGREFVTGIIGQQARLWSTESGEDLESLPREENGPIGFAENGRSIVSGDRDGRVSVWAPRDHRARGEFHIHDSSVTALRWLAGARTLAVGCSDGSVRILYKQDDPLDLPTTNSGWVTSMCFSPDGRQLATGRYDGAVHITDIDAGVDVRVLEAHRGRVGHVSWSPDGRLVASCGAGGEVKVWFISRDGESVFMHGHGGFVRAMAFSPDSARLASWGCDATVRTWDATTGNQLALLDQCVQMPGTICFSPGEGQVVLCGYGLGTCVWHPPSGRTACARSVACAPDGTRIAAGNADGTVRVWDSRSFATTAEIIGHEGQVDSVGFSPDGERLVTAGRDGAVRMWDTETGRPVCELPPRGTRYLSVAFTPDGARVAGRSSTRLRMWEVANGQCLSTIDLSADGLAVDDEQPRCWYPTHLRDCDVLIQRVWTWDGRRCVCVDTLDATGSCPAVSMGPPRLRVQVTRGETVIEDAESGRRVAWLPVALRGVALGGEGSVLVGWRSEHLYIHAIESDLPQQDSDASP